MKVCKRNFRMTIFYEKNLSDIRLLYADVFKGFFLVSVHDLCWNFKFSVASPLSPFGINFKFWELLRTFRQKNTHRDVETFDRGHPVASVPLRPRFVASARKKAREKKYRFVQGKKAHSFVSSQKILAQVYLLSSQYFRSTCGTNYII
jgi:hypothetical protein